MENTVIIEEQEQIIRPLDLSIKSLSEDRVGAYGIIWGDETRKDAHGEYFDQETEDILAIFKSMGAIPFLFHHGADGRIKSTVIGIVDTMEPDDVGLWYEAKIKEQEMYKQYVSRLVQEGKLYSSSGTLPAAKAVKQNGHITRWPVMEMTSTWIPAEFRMILGGHSIDEMKSYYKSIGIDDVNFSVETEEEVETIETEIETADVEDTVVEVEVETVDTESMKKALDLEKLTLEILYSYS